MENNEKEERRMKDKQDIGVSVIKEYIRKGELRNDIRNTRSWK